MTQKREEPFEVHEQSLCKIGDIPVAAVEMALRQGEELLLQRYRFGNSLVARDGTVADAGAVPEPMPEPEQLRVQRQNMAAKALCIARCAEFKHAQDISFEVRPASRIIVT